MQASLADIPTALRPGGFRPALPTLRRPAPRFGRLWHPLRCLAVGGRAQPDPLSTMAPSARDARGPDGAGGSGAGAAPAAGGSTTFQQSYPAVAESVSAARAALVAFVRRGRIAQERVDAIALAASEAMTNVVVHAYRDDAAPGSLDVSAALAGGELWVIVTDRGSGLKPRRDSPGLGLGLAIIARVADGVDLLKPAAGGLELRMRFEVRAERA